MGVKVLEQLKSDEFAMSVGFVSTSGTLRRVLSRKREIKNVRDALRQGAITEDTIRRFVSSLMADFHHGKQFLHELALSALVVALETRPTDFADEFLCDLAQLKLAEMSLCIRVARECRKYRTFIVHRTARTINLLPPGEEMPFSVASWESTFPKNNFNNTNTALVQRCDYAKTGILSGI